MRLSSVIPIFILSVRAAELPEAPIDAPAGGWGVPGVLNRVWAWIKPEPKGPQLRDANDDMEDELVAVPQPAGPPPGALAQDEDGAPVPAVDQGPAVNPQLLAAPVVVAFNRGAVPVAGDPAADGALLGEDSEDDLGEGEPAAVIGHVEGDSDDDLGVLPPDYDLDDFNIIIVPQNPAQFVFANPLPVPVVAPAAAENPVHVVPPVVVVHQAGPQVPQPAAAAVPPGAAQVVANPPAANLAAAQVAVNPVPANRAVAIPPLANPAPVVNRARVPSASRRSGGGGSRQPASNPPAQQNAAPTPNAPAPQQNLAPSNGGLSKKVKWLIFGAVALVLTVSIGALVGYKRAQVIKIFRLGNFRAFSGSSPSFIVDP